MKLIPLRTYQQKMRFYLSLMIMSLVSYIVIRVLININL